MFLYFVLLMIHTTIVKQCISHALSLLSPQRKAAFSHNYNVYGTIANSTDSNECYRKQFLFWDPNLSPLLPSRTCALPALPLDKLTSTLSWYYSKRLYSTLYGSKGKLRCYSPHHCTPTTWLINDWLSGSSVKFIYMYTSEAWNTTWLLCYHVVWLWMLCNYDVMESYPISSSSIAISPMEQNYPSWDPA